MLKRFVRIKRQLYCLICTNLNITVIWSLFGQCWNRKSLSYFAKNFDGSLKAYLPLFGGGQSQQVITTLTGECSALTLVEPRGIPKIFILLPQLWGGTLRLLVEFSFLIREPRAKIYFLSLYAACTRPFFRACLKQPSAPYNYCFGW